MNDLLENIGETVAKLIADYGKSERPHEGLPPYVPFICLCPLAVSHRLPEGLLSENILLAGKMILATVVALCF